MSWFWVVVLFLLLDSCDEVQIWKTWDGGRFYMDWGMAESAYKAMLSAAPKLEDDE